MSEIENQTERREQVIAQCKVIAHLATALAEINRNYAEVLATGKIDEVLDIVGPRTAHEMECLGNFMNERDAVSDDDEWTFEIFRRAQAMFPQEPRP